MSAAIPAASAAGRQRAHLWRDVGGLLKEFWAAHPPASLGLLAVLLVGNAMSGLSITAMGGVVDDLSSSANGRAAHGQGVLFWLAAYLLAGVLEQFYWTGKNVSLAALRDRAAERLQRRVLERAAAAPLLQFEDRAFFDHLQRATAGMGERLADLSTLLVDLGQLLVMLGSVAVALYVVQPVLLPILVAGTLPALWLQARVASAVYQAQRGHTTPDRVRRQLQHLLTSREAAGEVRLFGTADYLLGRWSRLREARTNDLLAAEGRRARAATAGDLIAGLAYAAALVLVALALLRGQLSIGNYVTVAAGALSVSGLLGAFVGLLRSTAEQAQFLGDLFAFWRITGEPTEGCAQQEGTVGAGPRARPAAVAARDQDLATDQGGRFAHGGPPLHRGVAKPTPATPSPAQPASAPVPSSGTGAQSAGAAPAPTPGDAEPDTASMAATPAPRGMLVETERLTFAYPGSPRPALRDISLRIERGERIAIVGENGAGKTTLVKLLIGLYQPQAGSVRLDGVLLTPESAPAAQRRVAAVFQGYAAFALSLRDTIAFGDLERRHDDRALITAAERAGLADLLARLPGGLDGFLGRQFGATDLSGGQWQRTALARASFRAADLLVLDEPTAALDPLAELALFERFADLAARRTALMISHRLGMARLADRVLVLDDGRIVEAGPHDQLIASGGAYAHLFAAQAQWYR